jgi:hypothetical protein
VVIRGRRSDRRGVSYLATVRNLGAKPGRGPTGLGLSRASQNMCRSAEAPRFGASLRWPNHRDGCSWPIRHRLMFSLWLRLLLPPGAAFASPSVAYLRAEWGPLVGGARSFTPAGRTVIVGPAFLTPFLGPALRFAPVLRPMRLSTGNGGQDLHPRLPMHKNTIIPLEHNVPSPAVLVLSGRGSHDPALSPPNESCPMHREDSFRRPVRLCWQRPDELCAPASRRVSLCRGRLVPTYT